MYVLKLMDRRGGYVAPPGQRTSYVDDLAKARKFRTPEEAERERCQDNEVCVRVSDILGKAGI